MEKITVPALLSKYKARVEAGQIQFLKQSEVQKEILDILNSLIEDFEEAEKKANKKGNLSEHLDWYETHKKGTKLWRRLVSYALNDIDADSKGNSKLFEYLDAATKFEDLLYGLDRYYRDHTLHCLWVYFLGEYILRDLLPYIHSNLNWYLFNDIEKDKSEYSQALLKKAIDKEKELCEQVNKKRDAIWCIMALCHDLGYSLAKLDKLNEKVKAVLGFFDLPRFQHIGYSLDVEHEYHVSQFLELMAMDVRIIPSENLKETLVKGYRDDSTYWRLCRALEKKQHGILSAYLIYKTLGIFADSCVRGPAEDWGFDDEEAIDNIIRGDILFAITQHEFDFANLEQLSSLADILILADELEEFSRYGRQILSRKYYDTTADATVSFKPRKIEQGQNVEINIVYDTAKHLQQEDVYHFYIRKAEQMCKFYSLSPLKKKDSKFCAIKNIKMTVKKEGQSLDFGLSRDKDPTTITANLPKAKFEDDDYKKYGLEKKDCDEREYSLTCDDDKLFVRVKNAKVPLREWLGTSDK